MVYAIFVEEPFKHPTCAQQTRILKPARPAIALTFSHSVAAIRAHV